MIADNRNSRHNCRHTRRIVKNTRCVVCFLIGFLFCFLFLVSCADDNNGGVHISFVDVGQGDCTLVQTAGETLLIDTGPASSELELESFLKVRGIKCIDDLILTHAHNDHIGNADVMLNEFDVTNVWLPYYDTDHTPTDASYPRLMTALENSPATYHVIAETKTLSYADGLCVTMFTFGTQYEEEDSNNYSIVVKVIYGDFSVLIMGDAEAQAESALLSAVPSGELTADILHVGHHGSSTSTTDELLSAVSPDVAVISCGYYNTYGHPTGEVLDRLEQHQITVYRTDTMGTINWYSDGTINKAVYTQ